MIRKELAKNIYRAGCYDSNKLANRYKGTLIMEEIINQNFELTWKELGLDYEVPEKVPGQVYEVSKLPKCSKCGYGLTQVRPGKYQCDNMYCR
mgnify:CR=1 FL=1|jgi:hypothetical protein